MNKNQSSMFTAISYSYISFIDEYLNLLKNPLYPNIQHLDEETAIICNEIKTLYLSLPTLMGAEGDFKEAYAKKLVSFRGILENKYRLLNAYKRELQHLSSVMNTNNITPELAFEEFGLTDEDALSMDFEGLAKDCATFVFSSKNPMDRQVNAASILPFVPMRMTKDSFLAYVDRSIHKINIEDTPSNARLLVSILKQLLDGSLYDCYAEEFIDIPVSIAELKELTDSEQFFEEAELLGEMLDHALAIVNGLYKVICTFSNLLIYDALTFETLSDLHVSFYDLYCSLQNILSKAEDADIFLETLPERVSDIKETLSVQYEKACKSSDIDPLFTLIHTYLMMDITHVFGFDTARHEPYSLEVNTIFKDFLGELKEYLATLSPKERKLRMQYFMSVIPLAMNESTFSNYVLQGFKNVAQPSRNLFTVMHLSNALEAGGYFEAVDGQGIEQHYVDENAWLEDFDDLDHHHPTDHHCSCGDDCSCDSTDHDHECNCTHPH